VFPNQRATKRSVDAITRFQASWRPSRKLKGRSTWIGRPRSGVTVEQANADLTRVDQILKKDYPKKDVNPLTKLC